MYRNVVVMIAIPDLNLRNLIDCLLTSSVSNNVS